MKTRIILAAVAALGLVWSGSASAQPEAPAIMLHVGAVTSKGPCDQPSDTCSELTTVGDASNSTYNVYLIAVPGPDMNNRLSGAEMGIWYETGLNTQLQVFTWTRCATLDFPSTDPAWPSPGSWNTVTWSPEACNEMNTEAAVAGYFYVSAYSPALMTVTPNPNTGAFKVAQCPNGEINLDANRAGWVSFGGASSQSDNDGCNPCVETCEPVAARTTTWGGLKRAGD